ncbi:hypothetical protein BD626DRAFT_395140 [Schizophyllum amplum]|uniref:Uncharacterized protein n=1 Tax=Schizophyllum amplum TaxID=97359 RepID=A0A550CSI7_9AGAR|nr:hypothetical protein BD626DRAFT_395140 [Auriculariopsis ampla]
MDDAKIALPKFLKLLTDNGVSVKSAMTVAGKIYKTYNTPNHLRALEDISLVRAGVDDKDTRKLVLAALRKAGYSSSGRTPRKRPADTDPVPGPSSDALAATTPARKRKRKEAVNDLLPSTAPDDAAQYGSLDFAEVLDAAAIVGHRTTVNRAPLMTAWAAVVAERLGFAKEEALSIASAFTEMNAITKGVSLGIYAKGKEKGLDAASGGAQPYVDLMGRRVALYRTQSGQWRALSRSGPTASDAAVAYEPSAAFAYISRAFRHTAPFVVGALRLLAASFPPAELNTKGYTLYADFRPAVTGWGERSEVSCDRILALRKAAEKEVKEAKKEKLATKEIGEQELKADMVETEDAVHAGVQGAAVPVKYEERPDPRAASVDALEAQQ